MEEEPSTATAKNDEMGDGKATNTGKGEAKRESSKASIFVKKRRAWRQAGRQAELEGKLDARKAQGQGRDELKARGEEGRFQHVHAFLV